MTTPIFDEVAAEFPGLFPRDEQAAAEPAATTTAPDLPTAEKEPPAGQKTRKRKKPRNGRPGR